MVSEIDEKRGLVKLYWKDVRDRVSKVEPYFTKIVDTLSPDKSFPLYLAYYPYGAYKGDTESTFLPDINGNYNRLNDPTLQRDIINNLGYGQDSSPLGMVLEKEMEYFIDLKDEGISIPWAIYSPGSFFSFGRNLDIKPKRIYAPNGVLSVTSGARSTFMLPNIGCATHHANLQRDFNVESPPPKSLYEQWYLFKEIINNETIASDWRSCLIYFSEKWVKKLHNDDAWLRLKMYLHEKAWNLFEYQRCRIYYDIAFSVIQKKRNLKPNPYLADTARHLFTTALGDAPGYSPAINDDALPYSLLQKVFVESYGLKKYIPTLMKPTQFNLEESSEPVYYSLQNPSTFMFSPKSRKISSTLLEMRELRHVMRIFISELAKENLICSGTILNKIAKQVEFNYFHNKIDCHQVISDTKEIALIDKRFNKIKPMYKVKGASFAEDAPFVRGCISISVKS